MKQEVVVLGGVRTAIGKFGGGLATIPPSQLAALVAEESIARSGVSATDIGHSVFGHVINTEPRDMYLSRYAAIESGVPVGAPAMNVNRLCGSGVQAVVSSAQHILLGDVDFALAGGAESMSRSPHSSQSIRTGAKMGDVKFSDMMIGVLNDPFGGGHMGVTAENVSREHEITREQQDIFAVESQKRAAAAIENGHFKEQIVAVPVSSRKGDTAFDTDEHVKRGTTVEELALLPTVFQKEGSVTAGNSSGINDGAAAMVLASRSAAEARGLQPKIKLLGYAHAGVRPNVMGIGPVPAVAKLLQDLEMSVSDFDVIESNEAFAAQACAVTKLLGLDPDKVNPNGGAIALGHPIGATGAILVVKAMHELERTEGRFALVTMCIGGGQGIAIALEQLT